MNGVRRRAAGRAQRRRAAAARPVWERAYRGHAYWMGGAKLGKVTRTAPGQYHWQAAGREGCVRTLAQARRAVEAAVAMADRQLDLFP